MMVEMMTLLSHNSLLILDMMNQKDQLKLIMVKLIHLLFTEKLMLLMVKKSVDGLIHSDGLTLEMLMKPYLLNMMNQKDQLKLIMVKLTHQ